MKPFLTSSECGDIAVTAAEGGIGYWSEISSYRPSRWIDEATNENVAVSPDFVYYEIRKLDRPQGEWMKVTPRVIREGFKLLVKRGFKFWDEDDAAGMDAVEADLVVQCGLFGGEVYG